MRQHEEGYQLELRKQLLNLRCEHTELQRDFGQQHLLLREMENRTHALEIWEGTLKPRHCNQRANLASNYRGGNVRGATHDYGASQQPKLSVKFIDKVDDSH